ncbi:MAG: uL15 family ribosomal protein [Candidatus Sungbacteria bacterium]|nr:uL15 family ribosomal protein [Candidatus Sungbacteria bacterium]
MQIHQLKPKTRVRRQKRVGRGGKRGTTSGRGTKGQKARAGHKIRPALRDIIKKLPKSRGYRFRSFAGGTTVVDLDVLAKNFKDGDKVTPQVLLAKGLVTRAKSKMPRIKILGQGNLSGRKLYFKDVELSRQAAIKTGWQKAAS